jgi:branched-subunit amino acid aminotransferase/4-amino-4-deoxychorismate lyase
MKNAGGGRRLRTRERAGADPRRDAGILAWAWLDGRFHRAEAPTSPMSSPALLRGEGIFETMACEGGAPLLFQYHVERLEASAETLGLRLRYRPRELYDAVARTLARNRVREAVARLMLLHGSRRDAVAILCRRLERPSPGAYRRGVALAIAPWTRAEGVPLHRHKTLNYWECQCARTWAHRRGAFDALFLTPDGNVLEGGATNVFCVRRGELLTPPAAMGLLPGVMRRFVMTAAREALGLRVREARLDLRDVQTANATFVTNAVIGALPVRRIGGTALRRASSVAAAVMRVYDRDVRPIRVCEITPERKREGLFRKP